MKSGPGWTEFDGVGDLKRGIIRCVGEARERFQEDALRMLRAVRFAAQLGFVLDEQTKQAICELPGEPQKSQRRADSDRAGKITGISPSGTASGSMGDGYDCCGAAGI